MYICALPPCIYFIFMLEFAFACPLLSGVSLPLTAWCKFPMVKLSLLGHQLTSIFMTYTWKPDWSIRWMKKRTETTELTENIDQKTSAQVGHAYSDEVIYYHSNKETWITCLRNHETKGTWTSPGSRESKWNRALWKIHQWKHQKTCWSPGISVCPHRTDMGTAPTMSWERKKQEIEYRENRISTKFIELVNSYVFSIS